MDNTLLPAEVIKELADKANDYAHGKVGDIQTIPANLVRSWECAADGWEAGATLYASKLHEVEQELKLSKAVNEEAHNLTEKAQQRLQDLRDKHNTARALLEKFISRHEAGLLPDRFIFEEIKNFLDGK